MLRIVLAIVFTAVLWPAGARADDDLRARLQWRVAPPVPVFAGRSDLPAGPTLEEGLEAAGTKSPAAARDARPKVAQSVIEGEAYPLRYRRVINRYFDLIRK